MRRAGLAVAASLMALASLTACGGGSTDEFCDLDTKFEDLDPTNDPDAAQDALDEAVDAAPDEIKSDVETIRDAFGEIDPEDPSSMEDIDMEAVSEASDNVSKFTEENCSE